MRLLNAPKSSHKTERISNKSNPSIFRAEKNKSSKNCFSVSPIHRQGPLVKVTLSPWNSVFFSTLATCTNRTCDTPPPSLLDSHSTFPYYCYYYSHSQSVYQSSSIRKTCVSSAAAGTATDFCTRSKCARTPYKSYWNFPPLTLHKTGNYS